ncbi:MAG: YjgN family protein [Exilibacterium sp.]
MALIIINYNAGKGQFNMEPSYKSSANDSGTRQAVVKPLAFSGRGGEFFGIWIVNLLLSIVTLGIYSAWAKVRTNQYFYGHTRLDGHSFRYLAKPLQILKTYHRFYRIYRLPPVVDLFPRAFSDTLLLFVLMPWLLIQGIRFNLRMTDYRNVRFSFKGNYGEAFVNMFLLPLVGVLSLYLAMPWVMKKIDRFVYSNIPYGGKPVQVNTSTGQYYKAVHGGRSDRHCLHSQRSRHRH